MFWIAIRPLTCPDPLRTALTRIALGMTSQCVWHERDTLLMDVSASLRLFGGLRGTRAELQRSLAPLFANANCGEPGKHGVWEGDTTAQTDPSPLLSARAQAMGESVAVGISISAMGAWLLVQSSVRAAVTNPRQRVQTWYYALSLKRLHHLTNPLPVARLPACKPYLKWFQGIGCTSIAALRRLPRAQLQARTQTAVLTMLDQIDARTVWPYHSCELPEHFVMRRTLDEPIEHLGPLQARLHPLLQQMCQWLAQRHLAVRVWEVRLFHAGRRVGRDRRQPPSRLRLTMAEPGWHFAHLAGLLDVRLQAWQLPAPVCDLMILSDTVEPRQLQPASLFVDDLTRQQDLRRTLDTLRARLGDDAIRIVASRNDYRPELANQWSCIRTSAAPAQVSAQMAAQAPETVLGAHHSPSWLLPAPEMLSLRDDRPWHNAAPLQLLYGPYRIETGWWDHQPAQRDYFVARDPQARHYWIYRERTQEGLSWYLHGLFG